MPETLTYSVTDGFAPDHRKAAVGLFWSAFRGKLNPVMRPERKALQFLNMVANPAHAISAVSADGELLGIAGYKTRNGAFIGGDPAELRSVYGWFGAIWRSVLLSLLERPVKHGALLMDGIIVAEAVRGQGVGSALLAAIKEKARELDCTSVRLNVIDTNPRARALYEKRGFVAQEVSDLGPLRYIFGFRRATTMVCKV